MTFMTPRSREWTFRRVVAELPFIPATSNWLKLLLSLLASFIWHFSGAIDSLILFIRCGAGISYTIILNISRQEEQATQQGNRI